MTGRQFTAAKRALGLSASQMAEALGMRGARDSSGPRNIRRWCKEGLRDTIGGRAMAEKVRQLVKEQTT